MPVEAWNSRPGGISGWDFEQTNCAYLSDARGSDGHFYLLYAGSTELDTFDGWAMHVSAWLGAPTCRAGRCRPRPRPPDQQLDARSSLMPEAA